MIDIRHARCDVPPTDRVLAVGMMVAAALLLSGCTGYRALRDPALGANLVTNERLTGHGPGSDIRTGKRGALAAFNVFYYADETAAESHRTKRQEVTVSELRNLTDAMLHAFLDRMRTVPGIKWLSSHRVLASRPYLRLPGHIGAKLAPLPLNKRQGILAAPYNLKFLQIPRSAGRLALRREITRGDAFSWLRRILGKTDVMVEPEDLGLLAEQLEVDFIVCVNNQVRFTIGPSGDWEAHLELAELLIAGPQDLQDLAYARYVKGDFIATEAPLASDPTDPQTWQLMLYTPLPSDSTKQTDLAQRDFAALPFWPHLAPPYRRVAEMFRKDLAQIRESP